MHWSSCDDEMKMGDFLEKISDESKLRRFALELACTVLEELSDPRLIEAVGATEDYLNGAISEIQLKKFHANAELAFEDISVKELDLPDEVTDAEMEYEKAAVVVWAALPPTLSYCASPLEAARDSALHAAHYCRLIRGDGELENQVEVLHVVGLPSAV